jgi:hypothetical protein
MEPEAQIRGARRVEVLYSLAVFAIDSASGPLPAGALLVGRVATEMVFATAAFQVPLAQTGLARDTAEQLLVELTAQLHVNVDRVLAAGLVGQPLCAPAHHLRFAIKDSLVRLVTLRPDRALQVELFEARSVAREIVRQHLIHEQSMAGVNMTDVAALHFEAGPFGHEESDE